MTVLNLRDVSICAWFLADRT